MRTARWLTLVGVLVSACSTEHVVVATLDKDKLSPNGASQSGSSGEDSAGAAGVIHSGGAAQMGGTPPMNDGNRAGSTGGRPSGGSAGTTAHPTGGMESGGAGGALVLGSGGTLLIGEGGGRLVFGSAGTNDIPGAAGAAGELEGLMCACLGGETTQVCGTDGNTYEATCSADEDCFPVPIACLQRCPCPAEGEPTTGTETLFPYECAPTMQCRDGVVCMWPGSGMQDVQTSCEE